MDSTFRTPQAQLLEIITALGFELVRRGNAADEVQALRRYYVAVRRSEAKAPSFAFAVAPGDTWSAARVRERMGSLGLLQVAITPYHSSRVVNRGRH